MTASPSVKPSSRFALTGHRALAILAAEARRDRDLVDGHERRERDEAAVGRLDEQVLQIGRIVDRPSAGLDLNLDDLVADEEIGGLLVVDHGVDETGDGLDRHAELGCRLAVDADGKLRLRGVVVGARVAEARRLRQPARELHRDVGELGVVRSGDGEAQALAAAADAEAVGGLQGDREAGDVGELLLQLGLNGLLAALALAPGRECGDDRGAVAASAADRGQDVGDLARLLVGSEHVLDLLGLLRHVVEVAALLGGEADLNDAAILGGRDFLRQQLEGAPAERGEAEAAATTR